LEAYAVLGKLADIEKRLDLIEERLKRIESKLDDVQTSHVNSRSRRRSQAVGKVEDSRSDLSSK